MAYQGQKEFFFSISIAAPRHNTECWKQSEKNCENLKMNQKEENRAQSRKTFSVWNYLEFSPIFDTQFLIPPFIFQKMLLPEPFQIITPFDIHYFKCYKTKWIFFLSWIFSLRTCPMSHVSAITTDNHCSEKRWRWIKLQGKEEMSLAQLNVVSWHSLSKDCCL